MEKAISQARVSLGDFQNLIDAATDSWQRDRGTQRLWERDSSLFSGTDEASWMGWLDLPFASPDVAIGDDTVRERVRSHDSDTVVVVGMGGSSLWPTVLGRTFLGRGADLGRSRSLVVLDSTVPEALDEALAKLDLTRCLILVASKSGSTIEPNAIAELLYARLVSQVGSEAAGERFVAITDPGSSLEHLARERGFAGIAHGQADVGGRYSALSPFGLLPAEAMGMDVLDLQERAKRMATACAADRPVESNPGIQLGILLGTLSRAGRDKLTISTSPEIEAFAGWIDQLVAESTGKLGHGITPIVGESLPSLVSNDSLGDDRIFVELRLETEARSPGRTARDEALDALEAAGHPVVRILLEDPRDLVQEVFRWEIATAVAGSIWEINPFNQPDVEAAKIKARALLEAGPGPAGAPPPHLEVDGVRFFLAAALEEAAAHLGRPTELLRALWASAQDRDVLVINAFVEESNPIRRGLDALRARIGRGRTQPTTLAFGPRYLHSSGQLQKGGPNQAVGLHLWQSPSARRGDAMQIPILGGTFDALAEAQAVGDFEVLSERGRRMIGVDLGTDPKAGLEKLIEWTDGALA